LEDILFDIVGEKLGDIFEFGYPKRSEELLMRII
jgi:hypothetical protein